MPLPEIATALIAKLIGSVAGAILALVFLPPKTRSEFKRRFSASLIIGVVFAAFARDSLGFINDIEGVVAGACFAAFAGWWGMGTLYRVIRTWTEKD